MDMKHIERPGVYAIFHVDSGRSYIGSSINMRVRWRSHLAALRNNRHRNCHLQRAWDKYGESAFRFEVLEFVELAKVISAEQSWMDACKPAFNLLPKAGSALGWKMTPEQRAKQSRSATARVRPPEFIARLSAHMREIQKTARLGKHHSAEAREKIGAASRGKKKPAQAERMRGRTATPEARAKMSAARAGKPRPSIQGRPLSAEHRAKISAAQIGRIGPMTGKTHNDEARAKMSDAGRGRPKSPEHRAKIAAAVKATKAARRLAADTAAA